MTVETIGQWVISQGIGAVLAAAMFLIYRKDSKDYAARAHETAQAYMTFGERYAEALAQVGAAVARQADILDRMEGHLSASVLCPVSQVTAEVLREAAGAPVDHPRRRGGDRAFGEVVQHARRKAAGLVDPAEGGGGGDRA